MGFYGFLDRHLYPRYGKYVLGVAVLAILVGVYGAINYSVATYDEKYAVESSCLVVRTAIVKLNCGKNSRGTCYKPTWIVRCFFYCH